MPPTCGEHELFIVPNPGNFFAADCGTHRHAVLLPRFRFCNLTIAEAKGNSLPLIGITRSETKKRLSPYNKSATIVRHDSSQHIRRSSCAQLSSSTLSPWLRRNSASHRASELCHVAQPAISQQIQSLEKELGSRSSPEAPKVELTPAGRQYYQDVSGVLAALQRADRHASAIAHGQAGTLDIGVASPGQSEIFRVISRFHALHPEISIGSIARSRAPKASSCATAPTTRHRPRCALSRVATDSPRPILLSSRCASL